ncbi:hypothetical protein HDU88_007778 [Geranomyces variabilis]|nr:hypothetical protein HDU88_007778 [Geranomyces variabilis]
MHYEIFATVNFFFSGLLSIHAAPISQPAALAAIPKVSVLDGRALYFKSYDTIVNVASFQSSAILTHAGAQYAVWYSSNREAMIARRKINVGHGRWETAALGHKLSVDDSHNVISLGLSPIDETIHIALDMHSTKLYYLRSEVGLASAAGQRKPWTGARFGKAHNTLLGTQLEKAITYPQFVVRPTDNTLQLFYRSGISGNGVNQVAEYRNGAWKKLGGFMTTFGAYKSPRGAISLRRNLYVHGFTYSPNGRLHLSGTWREQNSAVMCSLGGLSNHDTLYAYSDDGARTWKNHNGNLIARTGTNSVISIYSAGLVVDRSSPDHALMNQESQTVDGAGNPHVLISYVPGSTMPCSTSYAADRAAHGRVFHLWQNPATKKWEKSKLPFALGSPLRSQILMDGDVALVLLPFLRIATSSTALNYKKWTMLFDGVKAGWKVEGEVTFDRQRWAESKILSVLFQADRNSLRVAEFKFK